MAGIVTPSRPARANSLVRRVRRSGYDRGFFVLLATGYILDATGSYVLVFINCRG